MNDNFADAVTLFDGTSPAPGSGSAVGTTTEATEEANEPTVSSATLGGSVVSTIWYKWIAPTTPFGVIFSVTYDTLTGTNRDTVIDVYQQPGGGDSSDISTLTFVAGNDDGPDLRSQINIPSLPVSASSTVVLFVRVGMWKAPVGSALVDGVPGSITLSWSFVGESLSPLTAIAVAIAVADADPDPDAVAVAVADVDVDVDAVAEVNAR